MGRKGDSLCRVTFGEGETVDVKMLTHRLALIKLRVVVGVEMEVKSKSKLELELELEGCGEFWTEWLA